VFKLSRDTAGKKEGATVFTPFKQTFLERRSSTSAV
jgi:hypothetical protein